MKFTQNEIERVNLTPKTHTWTSPHNIKYLLKVPNTVYPPREDTNLLAETIMSFGKGKGKKILEIGCGTGVISLFAKTCGWDVIGCDINPLAIATSRGLAKKYLSENIEFIEGGIEPQSVRTSRIFNKGPFDLIVWNLPYLEKPNENELLGPLEDASLADIGSKKNSKLHQLLIKKIEKENSLKNEGNVILIHNNIGNGRTLTSDCRKLGWASREINQKILPDGEKLHATALWKPWANSEKITHEELDSTNSYLLDGEFPIGTLIIAKKQIKGRGQRKNNWTHIKGGWCGSWNIALEDSSAAIIQAKAGLAVLDSIATLMSDELPTFDSLSMMKFSKHNISMKWPNDLLINSKKFAGILSEARTQGDSTKCVLGIGCNLTDQNDEISSTISGAASLKKLPISKINQDEWEMILHASIASKFEKSNLFSMDSKSRTMNEWWLSMEQFNKTNIAIIDSIKYKINSLYSDGSIGLIPIKYNISPEIRCYESFNLKWEKVII